MKSSITIPKNTRAELSHSSPISPAEHTLPAPHIHENYLHRAIFHILYLLQCHLVKSSSCLLCSLPRTTHTNQTLPWMHIFAQAIQSPAQDSISGLCDQYLVTIFPDELPREQNQEYHVPPTHFLPSLLEIIFKPVVWLQPNLTNKQIPRLHEDYINLMNTGSWDDKNEHKALK